MKSSSAWDRYRSEMQKHIDEGDFRHPWQWSTVVATMYVGQGKVISEELKEIRRLGVVAACSWSTDEDCTNLIHQRYHILQWELANPDKKIPELQTIFEVGAGYGAMAIILSRLSFRGTLNILDLPELEIVQRQHLAFRGIKCRLKWRECIKPDLLIAISSLSEIPIDDRRSFMDRLRPKSYLITYQPDWESDDNRTYFKNWAENLRANGGPPYMIFEQGPTHDYLISTAEPQ